MFETAETSGSVIGGATHQFLKALDERRHGPVLSASGRPSAGRPDFLGRAANNWTTFFGGFKHKSEVTS